MQGGGVGDCRCAGLGGVQGGGVRVRGHGLGWVACRQCESGAWGLGSEGGCENCRGGLGWSVGWVESACYFPEHRKTIKSGVNSF